MKQGDGNDLPITRSFMNVVPRTHKSSERALVNGRYSRKGKVVPVLNEVPRHEDVS